MCGKAVDGGGDVHAQCRVLVAGQSTVERTEIFANDICVDDPIVHRYNEVIGCLCAQPMPMPLHPEPFIRLRNVPSPGISYAEQLWFPPRCETCGECVFERWEDAAAHRPLSSKVSRKRVIEQ